LDYNTYKEAFKEDKTVIKVLAQKKQFLWLFIEIFRVQALFFMIV